MFKLVTAVVFLVLLTVSSFTQQSIKVGSPAPEFVGTAMDGSEVDLRSLKGKIVVMTFWSTRCLICHNEIPKLNALTTRFEPAKVVFLALSMENEEKIEAYLKKNPFRFQILPNSFSTVLQYADRDRTGNLDMGFPSFFIIDQSGIVRQRASGYDKTSSIESAITRLSAK